MMLFLIDRSLTLLPGLAPSSLTINEAREIPSLLVSPAIDVLGFLDAALWEGAHHSLGQLVQFTVVTAFGVNKDVSTCKQLRENTKQFDLTIVTTKLLIIHCYGKAHGASFNSALMHSVCTYGMDSPIKYMSAHRVD